MRQVVRFAAVVACLSVFGCISGCDATTEGTRGEGEVALDPPDGDEAIRERDEVDLEPNDLFALGAANGPDRMSLRLFDDVALELAVDGVETLSETNVIVNAHVSNDSASSATLVAKDGVIVGSVTHDGHLYEIKRDPRGRTKVREIDPGGAERCRSEELSADTGGAATAPIAATPSEEDGGSALDLMVAYTPSALQQAGSAAAIEAAIQMAINDTSLTYANSGMAHRARLVGMVALRQAESGNMSSDLTAARGTSDGKWDEIHALRAQYGADQVSVVIAGGSSGTLGIGYVGGGRGAAFTVTKLGAFSRLTFTHELGHNLGLRHEDDFESAAGNFRQVMAYGSRPRIRYHSNPAVVYNGIVMGNATYNSVAKLEKSIPAMEGYYGSAGTPSPTPTPTTTSTAPPPPPPPSTTPTPGTCEVTVISPNGGEVVRRGSPVALRWSGAQGPEVRVRLQRVYSNGTSTSTLARTANDGSATWTPSTSLSPGNYKIIVVDESRSSCLDASDRTFTLQ